MMLMTMLYNFLDTAFNSALGPVDLEDIWKSLRLMLEGMVGIFVVMVLIFLVIFILSRTFDRKKDDDTDKMDGRSHHLDGGGLCQMVHRYRKESGADGLFQRAGLHDYRALWLGHLGKYPGYFRP